MRMYFFSGVCDFEKDTCGFTQDQTDKFDWSRKNSKTPTPGTGPMVDHTLGSSLGKRQILHSLNKHQQDFRAFNLKKKIWM